MARKTDMYPKPGERRPANIPLAFGIAGLLIVGLVLLFENQPRALVRPTSPTVAPTATMERAPTARPVPTVVPMLSPPPPPPPMLEPQAPPMPAPAPAVVEPAPAPAPPAIVEPAPVVELAPCWEGPPRPNPDNAPMCWRGVPFVQP